MIRRLFIIAGLGVLFAHVAWAQPTETKLLASDGMATDEYGRSISHDGTVAIIGARFDDDNGAESGSAYIYRYNGTAWVEEQKLTASDGAPGDEFGFSVFVNNGVAIVGALRNTQGGVRSGSAYIYRYNGTAWIEEQKLTPSGGALDDLFGHSVSLRSSVAVVGVLADDDNGTDSGSAYVYRYNGSTWVEEQKLTASDGASSALFGTSVSVDNNVVLVGSNRHQSDKGSAYVYRYNGSTWSEEQKLTAIDGASGDEFGFSVTLHNGVAVVGARYDDSSKGSAYVYRFNGTTWSEEQKLTASDGVGNDRFGYSVSIFKNTVVSGAFLNTDNIFRSGSAYVYKYNGTTWSETDKLVPSDGAEDDSFGSAVSVSDEGTFVGAYQNDDNGGSSGSAYFYETGTGFKTVSISNAQAQYGTLIDIPIQMVSDVTGSGIVASEISVTYRNDIVLSAVTNLTTTAGTVTTNSMVYQGWSVEENVFSGASVDTLTIAMSTAQDTLSGQGDLIYLTLQLADIRMPDSTALAFVNVLFNDGSPAAVSVDGSLKIIGTDATISTSPDSIRPSETVSIILDDVDLDLDVGSVDQVSVTAYSVTYGDSQSVTLTETGVNTGSFTGSVSTEFSAVAGTPQDGVIGTIAGDSIGVVAIDVLTSTGITSPLYAFPVRVYGGADGVVAVSYVVQALDGRNGVRDTVRVQVSDADLDLDVGSAESVSAMITNAISGESESLTLVETGVNTGVFQVRVPSIAGASGTNNDGVLSLASWDTLNVSYTDSLTAQGGVSPLSDISRVVNVFGDVQPNDQIQAFDAARLLAISVGLISSNTQTTLVGDVDGGGAIAAFDASLVLQYVVRLIDRFPVQTDFTADPKNHPFEKPVVSQMLALGNMSQQSDGTYLVPVQLSEREGVLSGILTFGADAGVEVMDVVLANAYGSFMVAHNTTDEGVKVAFAGSQSELSGSGDVLMLRVRGVEGVPIRLSLDQVMLNGQSLTPSVNIEALEAVESPVSTYVTELHQNLPNPFNPETTIRYGLADAGQVSVVIYSVTGQRVRTLVHAFQEAGAYQVTWNGQDALGHQVSSGVYLMRMQTGGFVQARKMLLMK